MKILLLCQGDAETRDAWSGAARSVVQGLRGAGHTVIAGNVEPRGWGRFALALRTVARTRRRWWVRFHLGEAGFRARSALAARRIREAGADVDAILQVGATFAVPLGCPIPVFIYCDSNIELAREGAGTGFSDAAVLTPREFQGVRSREAQVYRSADLIFTMSHRLRSSFIRDFQLPGERLLTVHCGPNVPTGRIPPPPRPRPELPPTILFVGREFHRKGGEMMLEAFREVRRRIPSARLRMVGGRPDPVGGTQIPEGVEFTGYLDRDTPEGRRAMEAAYRTATAFCLPTRYEPFGTAFVEAMLYGLPCVGPNAWSLPEIIHDGVTGRLITPPDDPSALADALVALLGDPVAAAAMGDAGRATALALFSWDRVVQGMGDGMAARLVGRGQRRAARSRTLEDSLS